MHHLAVTIYLFQRKVIVCESHETYPRTYIGCCGYSHVYVGLKKISV